MGEGRLYVQQIENYVDRYVLVAKGDNNKGIFVFRTGVSSRRVHTVSSSLTSGRLVNFHD